MKFNLKWLWLFAISCLVFTGCQSGGRTAVPSSEQEVSNEPVALRVMTTAGAGMTEEDFKVLLADPVKRKYPNITLELVKSSKGKEIQDLVAAGDIPDLVLVWNGALPTMDSLGILEDIAPLAKKFNVDLNRFDPTTIAAVKESTDKGVLFGLPYTQQFNALYYNKNIFDKFGVPYPKDGLTWDEAIDLARKLTRNENGVQYRGLDPESVLRVSFPLSITSIDVKTGKASINTDAWRKAFDTTYRIYSIPGNERNATFFAFSQQVVAMHAGVNLFDRLAAATKAGFTDWDVAQYPSFKEQPNVYGMVDEHVIVITKTSKYKEQAMQVIQTLVSDEVQKIGARDLLRASTLKDPEINKEFGAKYFKDKHFESIFKSRPAPAVRFSQYNNEAGNIVKAVFDEYAAGKDLNTALKEADEKINKVISSK